MAQNKTEFAEALDRIEQEVYEAVCEYKCSSVEVDCDDVLGEKTVRTIEKALLIADKLMQEPSFDMKWLGGVEVEHPNETRGSLDRASDTFKAMRDQLFKEIK